VSSLFGTVSADGHAAPPSRFPPGSIDEEQSANMPLTGLHVREVRRAHELGQGLAYRKKQRLWRPPATRSQQLEGRLPFAIRRNDPQEGLIAFEQANQGLQLSKMRRLKGLSPVLVDETSEPLAQLASLIRDIVQLAGEDLLSKRIQ
jgi:hypothetical protein